MAAAWVSDLTLNTQLVDWLGYSRQGGFILIAAGAVVVTLAARNGEIGGG
jgi:hypothetical protein